MLRKILGRRNGAASLNDSFAWEIHGQRSGELQSMGLHRHDLATKNNNNPSAYTHTNTKGVGLGVFFFNPKLENLHIPKTLKPSAFPGSRTAGLSDDGPGHRHSRETSLSPLPLLLLGALSWNLTLNLFPGLMCPCRKISQSCGQSGRGLLYRVGGNHVSP